MSRAVRYLLPAMIFAAVLILLIEARPFATPDRDTNVFLFEVDMAASQGGEARLFFDMGNGLRPQDSYGSSVEASDEPRVRRFRLPAGVYRGFSFDLLNRDSDVVLGRARIVSLQGDVVKTIRATDWQSSVRADDQTESRRFATRQDGLPELTLKLPEPIVLAQSWTGDAVGMLVQFVALSAMFAFSFWRLDRWTERRGWHITDVGARLLMAAQKRPRRFLLGCAVISTILSCYPIVFFGKSFVSPNYEGITMLYPGFPTVPGNSGTNVEDAVGSDMGAMLWQNLPYSVVQCRSLAHFGELPLWNRYNSSGVTLLGQGISMFGDPLHVIVLAAGGVAWAWDLKFLLAKMVFSFGLGCLVCATTKHLPSALLLTFSAAFLGFFSYRFNHPAFFSMCYAPWLLLCWVQIAEAPGIKAAVGWICGLLLASWVQLSSGTVKEAYMLLVCLHGTGLLIFLLTAGGDRTRKLLHLSFAGVLFVLLSAPIWLTFIGALKTSYTAYDRTPAWQIQPGLLIGLFDDVFYRSVNRWGRVFDPSANFLILLGCLLTLTGLKTLFRDQTFLAIGLGALPAFALVFGVVPPALIGAIPVLKNIGHVDNTFSCVLIIQLIVLAGFGFRYGWKRMGEKDWPSDFGSIVLGLSALLIMFLGLTQAVQRPPDTFAALGGDARVNPFFRYYSLSLIVAVLALPWLVRSMIRRSPSALAAAPLVLLCMFALHWRHGMHLRTNIAPVDYSVMNPAERIDLQVSSPALDFLHQQKGAFRTVGLGDAFYPGYNALAGLESIYGTDPLINPYYRELLSAGGVRLIWTWRWIIEPHELAKTLRLYSLLNTRYFLEEEPRKSDLPLRLLASWDLKVYENDSAWPRAFFVDAVSSYESVDDFVRLLREGDGRPFAAVQRGSAQADVVAVTVSHAPRFVPAVDYRLTNNQTEFTIEASGPGVAVLTETYVPGDFVVRLNGTPVEDFRINHAFRGVKIPQAGTYRISFAYWPAHFTASLLMSGLGFLLLASWLAMVFRARKTTDPAPPSALEAAPLSHV